MAIRTRSLVLFFFALASGLAAGWLALSYLRKQSRPLLSTGPASTGAVVAARDLPVGTLLQERDLKSISWPGDALPPGMVTVPEGALGRGLIAPLRVNEPIMESKLAPREVGSGLHTLVAEGMRALSIRVDDVIGVSGFTLPGTRVDVMLTTAEGAPANEPTTRIILQNIPIIAAGQSIQTDPQGRPVSVPVISMLVSPEQAETLALASGQGRIQLALRNTMDTLPVNTPGARTSTLLYGSRGAGRPPAAPRGEGWRPRAALRPSEETAIVEGFRGGERTVNRFTRPTRDTMPEGEDQ